LRNGRDGRHHTVLMVAHTLEVFVWGLAYTVVGAAPAGGDLPVQAWQLAGLMAAMSGFLMFSWSTAALFDALHKTLEYFATMGTPGFTYLDRG
jgi:hypothetical protein